MVCTQLYPLNHISMYCSYSLLSYPSLYLLSFCNFSPPSSFFSSCLFFTLRLCKTLPSISFISSHPSITLGCSERQSSGNIKPTALPLSPNPSIHSLCYVTTLVIQCWQPLIPKPSLNPRHSLSIHFLGARVHPSAMMRSDSLHPSASLNKK